MNPTIRQVYDYFYKTTEVVEYKKYNELPWWGYTKIADNFPAFGISAASRNHLINRKVPTRARRLLSFTIALLITLALVLLLIVPGAALGSGLFAAGGMSAITPIITGAASLLGAAAYFGIKYYQNAQSLKRNLDLADKRDQIISANTKYKNTDTGKKITNRDFRNTHITEETLNKILDKAKKHFPEDQRLQKIYVGAQLLKCVTSENVKKLNDDINAKTIKFDIAEKFNEFFDLNKNDVGIKDKNDALLACVARNHYNKMRVNDDNQRKQLAKYIKGARNAFYNCDVSDDVVNIALNNAVGSYYEDDNNNFIKKFYDKDQGDNFYSKDQQGNLPVDPSKADIFNKKFGIQKVSPWGEAFGSALATLPIVTGIYNSARSGSELKKITETNTEIENSNTEIENSNTEIDKIFKSYENRKKIDSDVAGLDSSGNGRVTIDECKAYASRKGIAEQDVYDWMTSYGITAPTSDSSITVESIVMNKSLGAGFTKYINDNYSGDKSSAIDPKVFDAYNSATTTYDKPNKKLTISFGNPANTITLDENQIKRFAASTGKFFTTDDKDAFSKAVLAQYKVFATEIKSASIYTITTQEYDQLMKAYGITEPTSKSSKSSTTVQLNVIDPKVFDDYDKSGTTYDKPNKKLTISFGNPANTITLDENQIKRFAASTGTSLATKDNDSKTNNLEAFSKAVLEEYKVIATDMQKNVVKNPSGLSNYLNGLKKENGFAADSMKVASAKITTIEIPAEMSKAQETWYETLFKGIPELCENLRKLGPDADKAGVKDLVDSLFGSVIPNKWLSNPLEKLIGGDGMTVGDFKRYLYGAGPGTIDYVENFSKYMYYSVQPNGEKDAAKCLTNMNALLDKMCSEEPGKSYTEQFCREKFNASVGDGSATQTLEKFKKQASNIVKIAGSSTKVINKFNNKPDGLPGVRGLFKTKFWDRFWSGENHLLSGSEAKVNKLAYTEGSINVNWSESKTVNMLLGDNVAPSDTKGDLKQLEKLGSVVISDMRNSAIVGALGGFGAGLVGGGFALYDNKKNNQYLNKDLLSIQDQKKNRSEKKFTKVKKNSLRRSILQKT